MTEAELRRMIALADAAIALNREYHHILVAHRHRLTIRLLHKLKQPNWKDMAIRAYDKMHPLYLNYP